MQCNLNLTLQLLKVRVVKKLVNRYNQRNTMCELWNKNVPHPPEKSVAVEKLIDFERWQLQLWSRKLAVEPEVSAASTDIESNITNGADPGLTDDIPDRQIVARERYCHCLRLVRLEANICEALQNRWRLVCFSGMVNVKLGNLQ